MGLSRRTAVAIEAGLVPTRHCGYGPGPKVDSANPAFTVQEQKVSILVEHQVARVMKLRFKGGPALSLENGIEARAVSCTSNRVNDSSLRIDSSDSVAGIIRNEEITDGVHRDTVQKIELRLQRRAAVAAKSSFARSCHCGYDAGSRVDSPDPVSPVTHENVSLLIRRGATRFHKASPNSGPAVPAGLSRAVASDQRKCPGAEVKGAHAVPQEFRNQQPAVSCHLEFSRAAETIIPFFLRRPGILVASDQ